jgi:predicted alpha/beta superfamily hydrolase
MIKYLSFAGLLWLMVSCQPQQDQHQVSNDQPGVTRMYAKAVGDSFSIYVQLPADYLPGQRERYPVVYMLDANLYYDIMATTLQKYATVGLAPNVILVGIGYKDFMEMDSLRNRDDTYPVAIPEYEMSVSGGADKFLSFINNELISHIDATYQTDTTKRVLMGHSLGGYFTMYAFWQDLLGNSKIHTYIAASPSLHYNNYYLLDELTAAATHQEAAHKRTLYLTYGGLENGEDTSVMTLNKLSARLAGIFSARSADSIRYKSDIYSNLDHMDTQLPTFIKGLQWGFEEGK